jgi:DNA-binding NarL/FixJ family response regulator
MAAPARLHPPRVLLADDHPGVRAALERLLESSCDIVASVGTGRDAVETAERLVPDVVVLDVSMPDLDGIAACRQLHRTLPGLHVILMSGTDEETIRTSALHAGADAFVVKYRAAGELARIIEQIARPSSV